MSKHNIQYSFIDIEQDDEAGAYVEKVNQGNKSVPTIIFPDGSVLVEPSDAELEKKLMAYTETKNDQGVVSKASLSGSIPPSIR